MTSHRETGMGDHRPEIGQLLSGKPTGEYDIPEIGEAAFFYAYRDFCRVFWNINQAEWEDHWPGATIGGVTCRKYSFDEDDPAAALPNFESSGVEIRWYKHPGRSMSANVEMSPDEWAGWLRGTIAAIDRADRQDMYPDQGDVSGEGDAS